MWQSHTKVPTQTDKNIFATWVEASPGRAPERSKLKKALESLFSAAGQPPLDWFWHEVSQVSLSLFLYVYIYMVNKYSIMYVYMNAWRKKHKENSINGDKNGGPLCRFTSTMLSSEGECHSSAVFSIPFPHHHATNIFLFVPSHPLNIGHKNPHLKWGWT